MSQAPNAVCFSEDDYAGPLRRIVSFLIDFFVYILIYAAIVLTVQLQVVPMKALTTRRSPEQEVEMKRVMAPYVPLVFGAVLAAAVGYFVALPASTGTTVGKWITGCRIVDQNGRPPPFLRLLRRFALAVPLCGMFGVSYLLALKSARRQAMHDRWTGSWVVRSRAIPRPAVLEFNHQLIGPFLLHYTGLSEASDEMTGGATEKATPDMPTA